LAQALGQIYREMRGQGLSLPDLAMKTAQSHATEEEHGRALVELARTMNEFLALRADNSGRASQSPPWLAQLG